MPLVFVFWIEPSAKPPIRAKGFCIPCFSFLVLVHNQAFLINAVLNPTVLDPTDLGSDYGLGNFLNPLHRPSRSQDTPVQLVFKAAVCPALNPLNPLNPPNSRRAPQASLASSSSQGHSPFNSTNSSGWHAQLFLKVFKPIVCPPLNFLNPLHRPSRSQDRPRPTVFKGVQRCRLPDLKPLKPSKPSARPPKQALRPAAARATAPAIQQIPAVGTQPGKATSNCF